MSTTELWPPAVGEVLPRAAEAYTAPEKWDQWILAERGHGWEWAKVFRVGATDAERIWSAIAEAVLDAPIASVRDGSPHGLNCQVRVMLTLDDRTAHVMTIWHYASKSHAPRLVTAYPIP
jgi:hypothetical protein